MMSWSDRNARRGAMSEGEFLDDMRKAGFRVIPTRPGFLWEFEHPETGGRRFVIQDRPVETYSAALPRLLAELSAARRLTR